MSAYREALPCVLAMSLLCGCYAGINADVVPKDKPQTPGIRYYLPAPYLIVERDARGNVDANIHYLADRSRVYYVEPFVVLASQKAEIELNADGTLKTFKLEQDTTAVSAAVVEGVKDVVLKKLDLEKADAEERAKRAASASEAPTDKPVKTWIFALRGTQATLLLTPELSLPAETGGGGRPTGKIEGAFTEPKLTALHDINRQEFSVAHSEHTFADSDLNTTVTFEGLQAGAARTENGKILIKDSAVSAAGAKVKFGGEEVLLKRGP